MTDMTQEQADALEAAKAVRPDNSLAAKQITASERKIKRAAVFQVRRFFYGPTAQPTIRNQALHFCSFGSLVHLAKMQELLAKRQELGYVRTGD